MKEETSYYWELIEKGSWELLTNEEKTYINANVGKDAYLEDLRMMNSYAQTESSKVAINRSALLAYAGKSSNNKYVYTLIAGTAAGFIIAFLLNIFGNSSTGQLPEIRTVAHYDTITVEKTIYDTVYKDRIFYSQRPKTYSVKNIQVPKTTDYEAFPSTKIELNEAIIENKGENGFDLTFNQNFISELRK